MKDTMFFAFFTAISEKTGRIYQGFRLCKAGEDEHKMTVPDKADMVDHVYRQHSPYGDGVGAVTILRMRYKRIKHENNILLNLN